MVLKRYKDIERFIPSLNLNTLGINGIKYAPSQVVSFLPLYAIVVKQNGIVEHAYKARLATFRTTDLVYMLVNDTDISKRHSIYISIPFKDYVVRPDNKYGFKVDDIGLHIISNSKDKEKVYFATSFLDAAEVRNKIGKQEITFRTEIVYV